MAIRFEPNKGATDPPEKPTAQKPAPPLSEPGAATPAEAELPFAKPVRPEKKPKLK